MFFFFLNTVPTHNSRQHETEKHTKQGWFKENQQIVFKFTNTSMAKSLKQSQAEEDFYGKYMGSFMLMHNRWVAPKRILPGLKMKCQIIPFRAVNLQFGPRRSTSSPAGACLDKKISLN